MAKKAKKKISVMNFAVLGVLVVCLILAIVGLAIDDWMVTDTLGQKTSSSFADALDTISNENFQESVKKAQESIDKAEELGLSGEILEAAKELVSNARQMTAMVAFALITVLLLAIATIAYALKMFVNIGLLRFVAGAAGILALIAAIVTIALTASLAGDANVVEEISKTTVGAGAALLAVGGILGGIAGGSALFIKK